MKHLLRRCGASALVVAVVAGTAPTYATTAETPACTVDLVHGGGQTGLAKIFYSHLEPDTTTYFVVVQYDAYHSGVHPEDWGQNLADQLMRSGPTAFDAVADAKRWAQITMCGRGCFNPGTRVIHPETLLVSDWQTEACPAL